MANKNINNIFESITPTNDTTERIYVNIKQYQTDYNQTLVKKKNIFPFGVNHKILKPIFAFLLCFIIVVGVVPFVNQSTAITVYAYGTNTEITSQGVEFTTGTISNSGEMKGHMFQMYTTGKAIEYIRFSCKNQYINFSDCTDKRQPLGMRKNFTIRYGQPESEYKYLLINWEPNDTIRTLTDNANMGIQKLSNTLREDEILMNISFSDGTSTMKAIHIKLEDNGNIIASYNKNVTTSDPDYFIPKLEDKNINSNEPIQTTPTPNDNNSSGIEFSATDISSAIEVAKKYYAEKTNLNIISITIDTNNIYINQDYGKEYSAENMIAFKVYVTSTDAPRSIILGRVHQNDSWKVLNEGF